MEVASGTSDAAVIDVLMAAAMTGEGTSYADLAYSLNLNDIGRHVVEKALERNGGNRKKAAQELGISDRTLYRRIKQYGLDKQ